MSKKKKAEYKPYLEMEDYKRLEEHHQQIWEEGWFTAKSSLHRVPYDHINIVRIFIDGYDAYLNYEDLPF